MTTTISIESSCDETAVSILRVSPNFSQVEIFSHVVESQIELHKPFGGVVPEVAARDHYAKLDKTVKNALQISKLTLKDIDRIAVTLGPGLIGALMVGVMYARGLALSSKKPCIGVNHIDAHLSPAFFLESFVPKDDCGKVLFLKKPKFPALGLTVSGGHCVLSYLESIKNRTILGKHLDDACGEAFDKVGKMLGLQYPGGPHIEKLAMRGNPHINSFSLPRHLSKKVPEFSFSYSGLKTAVYYALKKRFTESGKDFDLQNLSDNSKQQLAFEFQESAFEQLRDRVTRALNTFKDVTTLYIAGGVASNKRFREIFKSLPLEINFAPKSLCTDNATMIGLQSYFSSLSALSVHPFSKYDFG